MTEGTGTYARDAVLEQKVKVIGSSAISSGETIACGGAVKAAWLVNDADNSALTCSCSSETVILTTAASTDIVVVGLAVVLD